MTHAEIREVSEQHRREYEAGDTCAQIAAREGMKAGTVWFRLRKIGVVLRRPGNFHSHLRKVSVEDIPRLIASVRQTGNQSAVARAFGISRQRVSQIIQEHLVR